MFFPRVYVAHILLILANILSYKCVTKNVTHTETQAKFQLVFSFEFLMFPEGLQCRFTESSPSN